MQRCLLLVCSFLLMVSFGCQDGPEGDPEFKKEKVDKPTTADVQKGSGRAATPAGRD